jgi:hypothetical protein
MSEVVEHLQREDVDMQQKEHDLQQRLQTQASSKPDSMSSCM